jgi:hypothetical protein
MKMKSPIQEEMDRRARLAEKQDEERWDGSSDQLDIDDAAFPIEDET